MGIAVLRSHDGQEPHPNLDSRALPPMNPSRKKPFRSPCPSETRSVRSKPNPTRSPKKEKSETRKPLVMGQVTILKRGEDPNPKPIPQSAAVVDRGSDVRESSVPCSADRLDSDPNVLLNFSDLKSTYAGPAFISSPAPNSLPFPAFFVKKKGFVDDVSRRENATRGLKVLLRLDEMPR